MKLKISFPVVVSLIFICINANGQLLGEGGGPYIFQSSECISPTQSALIKAQLIASQQQLEKNHKLDKIQNSVDVKFQWPLRQSVNSKDPSYFGISNFVDHDSTFPNKVRDYNCGTRSYDQSSGYNHKGLDVYLWPHSQFKQENKMVEIIAAAAGTIIYKSDGQFDKSCNFCSNCNWNAVYIRHIDGSVAWYGHMKNGSTTTKPVGSTVETGEYLGCVGSSGNSTGPHLHFEVYADPQQTILVDPFAGTCNTKNAESWWANQKPYYEPTINRLQTHTAPYSGGTCPSLETLNESNVFAFATNINFLVYYHDQKATEPTKYEIFRPSGALYTTWQHNSAQTFASSYWYWIYAIPSAAGNEGYWKFRATYLSTNQVADHSFYVGSNRPVTTTKFGNWEDATIWSNGVVPATTATVFVQHRVTVNANTSCKELRVGEKGEVVTKTGITLNITGP